MVSTFQFVQEFCTQRHFFIKRKLYLTINRNICGKPILYICSSLHFGTMDGTAHQSWRNSTKNGIQKGYKKKDDTKHHPKQINDDIII